MSIFAILSWLHNGITANGVAVGWVVFAVAGALEFATAQKPEVLAICAEIPLVALLIRLAPAVVTFTLAP